MWSTRLWRLGICFSRPLSRRLTISRRNTPDLHPGSRNLIFLLLHRSAGRISRIRFTICGGVKISSLLRLAMQLKTSGLKLFSGTGDLQEMDWGIFPYRTGDKHVLTKIGEEGQLLLCVQTGEQGRLHGVLVPKQFAKSEIPPLQHAPVDRRPFGKDDMARPLAYRPESEGVAPNDVSFENKPHRLATLVLRVGLKQAGVAYVEDLEEPSSAIAHIVREDINPVDRGDG